MGKGGKLPELPLYGSKEMKPRHNNKSRVGLHFIAQIIEDEFEWIFREQTVADVGIDALVEETVNGNPTGTFIALQIKSGKGNVTEKERSFTYYISNTHYYYWINLELPIILTVYIKRNKKQVYWVELKPTNIQKTKVKWKVEIPKTQVLSKESFNEFEKIALKNKRKIKRKSNTENQENLVVKFIAIEPMSASLNMMLNIVSSLGKQIDKLSIQTQEATTIADETLKFRLFKIESELQYVLSNYATRTLTEMNIYSQLFSEFLIGWRAKYSLLRPLGTQDIIDMEREETELLLKVHDAFSEAIKGVTSMKSGMKGLENVKLLNDQSNLKLAMLANDQIIHELELSQTMIKQITDNYTSK